MGIELDIGPRWQRGPQARGAAWTAARNERALGFVLWAGLIAVLIVL